jgi:hypothetical protein
MNKPILKQRTTRVLVGIGTVVVGKYLARYLPADIANAVASDLANQVVVGTIAVLVPLGIYFRQKAGIAPTVNQQLRDTPRPR